jgi:tetratricopeptide (TPR) repeat protein
MMWNMQTALMAELDERTDQQCWEAVEEATELLIEGEFTRALECLRAVIQSNARNHYAYFHLASTLFELKRFEPARDAYRAAVMLSPTYLGARVGLSHTLRLLGDFDGARAEAEQALRQFPDDGDALYAAALALAASGDRRSAIPMFQRFLETGPELEAQLEVRGIIEMLTGAPEDGPFELA